MKIELGISSFGETTIDGLSHEERLKELIEEIELADKVGLDIFALGEHHRKDFAVSSPEIVLAVASRNTKNIKLSSAVTVLSSADPIRVYQNFSTLDLISNGRAEIMAGRGSFIESFPLFGYDLKDYEELFDEKLDMLLKIRENEILDWKGKFRKEVNSKAIYPRAKNLEINIASGGSYESSIKTAMRGLPITYAIIGGNPFNFERLIELYRSTGEKYGHKNLKVAAHSWGFIAKDNDEAIKKYFIPTKTLVDTISKERAHWSSLSYESYLNMIGENGAMFVGSPEEVAKKMIKVIERLKLNRFMLHLPIGSMKHEDVMEAIRLFGEEVAPIVRNYFKNI